MLSKVTQNLIQPINDSVVELTVVASNAQVHNTPIPNLTAVSTPVAANIKNLVVAARKTLEHNIIQSKSFLSGNLETEHENKINQLLPKIDAIGIKSNDASLSLIHNCKELADSPLHPDYLNGLVECLKIILLSTQDLLNIWDESEVLRISSVSKSLRERILILRHSDFSSFIKNPQLLLQVTKPVYQLAVMLIQLVKTRANDLLNPFVSQFLTSKLYLLEQMSPLLIAISKCNFEYVQVLLAMSKTDINVNMQGSLYNHCDVAINICLDIESALVIGDLPLTMVPVISNTLPLFDSSNVDVAIRDFKQSNTSLSFVRTVSNLLAVAGQYSQYFIPSGKSIIDSYSSLIADELSLLNGNKFNESVAINVSNALVKLNHHLNVYTFASLKQRLESNDPNCVPLLGKLLSEITNLMNTDAINYACLLNTLTINSAIRKDSKQMIESYKESLGSEFSSTCQVVAHEKIVANNFNNTCSTLYNMIFNQGKSSIQFNTLIEPLLSNVIDCKKAAADDLINKEIYRLLSSKTGNIAGVLNTMIKLNSNGNIIELYTLSKSLPKNKEYSVLESLILNKCEGCNVNKEELDNLCRFVENEVNQLDPSEVKSELISQLEIIRTFQKSSNVKAAVQNWEELHKRISTANIELENKELEELKRMEEIKISSDKVNEETVEEEEEDVPWIESTIPQPITILKIANDLKIQTSRWVKDGNTIVQAATRISETLKSLAHSFDNEMTPEQRLKIVQDCKLLIVNCDDLVKYALELAAACPDKRLKEQVELACERIPSIVQQLRILMNVKMSSAKNVDNEHLIISSAMNLSEAVGNVLWACEGAYVKINSKNASYTLGSSTFKVAPNVKMQHVKPRMNKFLQEVRQMSVE